MHKIYITKGLQKKKCTQNHPPQFFLHPRIPCRKTAVGGSGKDLSITELHLTCIGNYAGILVSYSFTQLHINEIH